MTSTNTGNGTVSNGVAELLPPGNESLPLVDGALSASGEALSQEPWECAKLRRVARRQSDKFISLIPDALRNDGVEAVNEMRVTSRRLEQILDLLYPKPRPRRIKKLRRRLKACRRALGALRNYDALLAMVQEPRGLAPASGTEIRAVIQEYLQGRRLQEAPMIVVKLGRSNLTVACARLRDDLGSDGLFRATAKGKSDNVTMDEEKDLLDQRITKSLDRLWRAFEDAADKSRRNPREHVVHRMRIAAKRLRYLTEAMEKLHIQGSAETVVWLRTFQKLVGRWHDRELMEHAMTDMLAKPEFRRDHPRLKAEVRKFIAHNREAKETLERKFSRMMDHSRHYGETKRWVTQLLTNGSGMGTQESHGNFSPKT